MKSALSAAKAWQIAVITAVLLTISLIASAQNPEIPQTPGAPAQNAGASQATPQQPAYQPKFAGDPARSNAEANALGYMRTVLRAQKEYKKKNDKFATSLLALVHTGSFTRRMAEPNRGDYTVGFKPNKNGFYLTLTPKELSADHRSFFSDEDGDIYADEEKAADEHSPKIVKIPMTIK
ncbi:MAG TPA: hypothetical protein VLK33_09575 [Terriglobales bacterium]|nr:hypothetical protein [Terriglobales bacterium]